MKVCRGKEIGHRVDGGGPDASLMQEGERTAANARKVHDEDALTAVVEFLSAFVLFLVIVSAFLALSQLNLVAMLPKPIASTRWRLMGWKN